MYRWNPEDYARHSAGQEAWARELLSGLNLRPDDRVLDIGCGDGRITAELAQRVPFGGVVGVDLSEDMIGYAARRFPASDYPNLEFRQADARTLPFDEEFTVVYSNAALHWVRDHEPVLAGIARALKPGGRCRMEMGGRGSAAALIAAFEAVADDPVWRENFERFEPTFGFHDAESYRRWLGEAGLDAERVRLTDKDMAHADREAFIGWLRTAWHPYTSRVPAERRGLFIDVVAERYLAGNPPDTAGRVHVAMVRLQVEAKK
ncbi:class I SAM-dependent methyltransferase [Methylocaldum sp. RMAD-M]|jgi:trans-aconitate 2-methyltransferase|uniref:class I SAM-dependent methyltransferase n=1 Tax=Methylocaldum sp. RMAD-M TaxID=2806557 RepID=UPI000A326713|nr:class I SAM-dependent methyltransferase [Methylocaldum sp. RMAD-M]MBP1148313.1 trans-aconitate methyltransferase [Methylocaldum sp. RMAD-M]